MRSVRQEYVRPAFLQGEPLAVNLKIHNSMDWENDFRMAGVPFRRIVRLMPSGIGVKTPVSRNVDRKSAAVFGKGNRRVFSTQKSRFRKGRVMELRTLRTERKQHFLQHVFRHERVLSNEYRNI